MKWKEITPFWTFADMNSLVYLGDCNAMSVRVK